MPDRVFFGHGACHVLAGVFLQKPPLPGCYAKRIILGEGFAGNHIYVTDGSVAFDYHGYSSRRRLLQHHIDGWASQYLIGWNCTLERVTFDLLDTAGLNSRKMLGPDQYFGDPVLRASRYLSRVNHNKAAADALRLVD